MNWLKVAAVIIGALIAFYIVGSVIHIITALLGVIVVLAVLGAGGYVAYKVVTSRRGRELRDRSRGGGRRQDHQLPDNYRQPDSPPPPQPARPNVDDELDRMRREMGS
ncbi:MAG: hypothetical protein JWM19_5539 [Actinomycetia bacterium]|nr:hypothetical protein [Actinomycetes bacterium]